MMNPFSTGYRFILGYIETRRFVSLKEAIYQLRKEGKIEEEKKLILDGQSRWIENAAPKLGMTFEVHGEENIPDHGPFMIYSNHQGFADIPATLWLMKDRFQLGYVAKEEWRKYPTLRDVVESTRSIFLVRENPKEAIKALSEAKELLDQGFNLVIFPEGHRSKRHQMGEFKAGAFKFAEKAKVPILPITIDGSYKLFEEKGSYQPCHIKITVHPLVHIEEMDKHEQKEAQAQIEETIRSAL